MYNKYNIKRKRKEEKKKGNGEKNTRGEEKQTC